MNEIEQSSQTVAILTLTTQTISATKEHWQEIADRLAERLQHPVLVQPHLPAQDLAIALEQSFETYLAKNFQRFVVMPVGLEPFDTLPLREAIAWLKQKDKSLTVHCAPAWTVQDWADAMSTPVVSLLATDSPSCLLLVADDSDGNKNVGEELSALAHHCVQTLRASTQVLASFTGSLKPSFIDALNTLKKSSVASVVVVPWRTGPAVTPTLLNSICHAFGRHLASPPSESDVSSAWVMKSSSNLEMANLLGHASFIHLMIEKYLTALSHRSLERYVGATPSASAFVNTDAWEALDYRVDQLLPSEYRGRTEEVSPKSMGSASLKLDGQGRVAWDEIWTSFCDLAMAGGPPHRGKLLEAVSRDQVLQNINKYNEVVEEIRRGIEMVTHLKTSTSAALGWVGVECDDEAMAVWLLRAIIVENIMVRREEHILYLPAGPEFTLKREVKNVITSVAKTVHYWRAHLRR